MRMRAWIALVYKQNLTKDIGVTFSLLLGCCGICPLPESSTVVPHTHDPTRSHAYLPRGAEDVMGQVVAHPLERPHPGFHLLGLQPKPNDQPTNQQPPVHLVRSLYNPRFAWNVQESRIVVLMKFCIALLSSHCIHRSQQDSGPSCAEDCGFPLPD